MSNKFVIKAEKELKKELGLLKVTTDLNNVVTDFLIGKIAELQYEIKILKAKESPKGKLF